MNRQEAPRTRPLAMTHARRYRIGIDVGGTFTHAVALDATTFGLCAKIKVPTTHSAPEGVARGIVEALHALLAKAAITPEQVALIAYSTTQATNALLEGDVAPVGILGMGQGGLACRATRVPPVGLAPGRRLEVFHRFLDTRRELTRERVREALSELVAEGAQAIAASEAFAVDDPARERLVLEVAADMGLPATAGHQVSQLYGLRARSRTAVINASMLPRMVESAELTEQSVRAAGIAAPLMVMRSDGGVMDLAKVRQQPILTMLSGPAAGVAAAMMHARISDGIFLEVGGTSTDMCAIRNGKAQIRSAQVGGHRLHLRTLDVRTLGVAGGSLARLRGKRLVAVGPRSAHIAGWPYAVFAKDPLQGEIVLRGPRPGDPVDHAALRTFEQEHAITPSCAAHLLALVPDACSSQGSPERAAEAFAALGRVMGLSSEQAADRLLALAAAPCIATVRALATDHGLKAELDARTLVLTGGGGGAAAIVPYVARAMGLPYQLAPDADVISAIGVALAMVRHAIARNVVDPGAEDLLKLRKEAQLGVEAMGADPATVEVQIEVLPREHLVRATATGATALRTKDRSQELSEGDRRIVAASSLRLAPEALSLAARAGNFLVLAAEREQGPLRKLFAGRPGQQLRVVDAEGVIRLQCARGNAMVCQAAELPDALARWVESLSRYDDGGKSLPEVFVLFGNRVLDLSGLMAVEQLVALARIEVEGMPGDSEVACIANVR